MKSVGTINVCEVVRSNLKGLKGLAPSFTKARLPTQLAGEISTGKTSAQFFTRHGQGFACERVFGRERKGLEAVVPFMLETRLRELGCQFEGAANWVPFAVRDGNLITGQNPQSSDLVAQSLLDALGLAKG
jgi:hypothetical protein